MLNSFGKIINNFEFGKSIKVQVNTTYKSEVTPLQGNLTPIYFIELL
jgi:hypothetical protein